MKEEGGPAQLSGGGR